MSAKTKTDMKDRFVIILAGGRGANVSGSCTFDRLWICW
jgi:hypothetical protein